MNTRRGGGPAIAIVGFGAAFPGGRDPDEFWRTVVEGRDATDEVPPGRWLLAPERAFDPAVGRADRVYTTRGGFLDEEGLVVDCDGLGVDPALVERLDPAFRLALRTAAAAWRSAKVDEIDRSRVGVVFGHIVLPTETTSALTRATIGRRIEESLGVEPSEPADFEPRNAFPAGAPARLVADALGLGGVAYTLDAACASSLYALRLACDELTTGRADAMIAGGVSRPDALYTQMGFSQLRALSPRGRSAPFDAEGDGLIVGEGAGLFVLKRLDDAVRQGDEILGVVRGVGLSNDVAGDLLAPSSEGQLRAMRAAYAQAGWSPDDVDLIECHATGTPVGDAEEFASLRALWADLASPAPAAACAIGSVKSNVGHALTAAGAAGLLKILLSFRHRTKPPTANHRRPSPKLGLESSPFRVLQAAEPWPERAPGRPRRAAISGFGFGGINAHALIEEWTGPTGEPAASERAEPEPVAVVGLAARRGDEAEAATFQHRVFGALGQNDDEASRLDALRIPIGRFRIPPRELEEMLLQQSFLLQTAAEAIADAGGPPDSGLRSGVIVGLGLDPNTTNYHLRWWLASRAPDWNREQGWGLSETELDAWVAEAADAIQPALTANRTMGSLGGLVASRVAREFRFGGPSFSVSSDEHSGLDALRIAADWLARGELDAAVVGAVDLAADPRTALAARRLAEGAGVDPIRPADCAVAMVLKRLADAERDGDRIYAVLGATGEVRPDVPVLAMDAPREALGWAGAAEGLAAVATGLLAVARGVVPPSASWGLPGHENEPARSAYYWLRNRDDGPRSARIATRSLDGSTREVALRGRDDRAAFDPRPLGPAPVAIFPVLGRNESERIAGLDALANLVGARLDRPIEALAEEWWAGIRGKATSGPGFAFVADGPAALAEAVAAARRGGDARSAGVEVFRPISGWDLDGEPQVAFTYPGLGAAYPGMGAGLSATWPELVRDLEDRFERAREQLAPEAWWAGSGEARGDDHRPPILGQISVGALMTSLFLKLGVRPSAAVGYSLGESAALVALGAWADRDAMARRLQESPLFATELAGPCLAARRVWGLQDDEPVDWTAALVPRSKEQVEAVIGDEARVSILIRNADDEVVIGGRADAVRRVVERLNSPFLPLPTVSTVHCPIGLDVEAAYRELHELKTTPVPDVTFYSGVWGTGYLPDHGTATAAITAQASRMIDYPAVVERAHRQGVRAFVEMGPGAGCTRLVGRILKDLPHLAVSADDPESPVRGVLRALGALVAAGVRVDLDFLYGREASPVVESAGAARREVVVGRTVPPLRNPMPPALPKSPTPSEPFAPVPMSEPRPAAFLVDPPATPAPVASVPTIMPQPIPTPAGLPATTRSFLETQQASAGAHEAFLRLSRSYSETMARQVAFALDLMGSLEADGPALATAPAADPTPASAPPPRRPDVALDRDQCLEYAIGSIGAVLGPRYAEVDSYPTRVRLPDEPLMLVDRIVTIEGTPFSLTTGRVVTEHDVLRDGWYLDGGRIASCVAIEAGQADLFLSGWLGIDFITKGLAVYRLLDATVTFHSELPAPGEVIRYDIRITGFFRQGDTHLFRFEFDGTVDGRPLLTMRGGCAGFFSEEELAAGKGVVPRPLDARPRPGVRPDDWKVLAPPAPCTLDRRQVDALRAGDLAGAFGSPFDRLDLARPLPLPGGLMTLVHRVETLDLEGGRFGLGLIRAEADVRPDDWFMVCHFVDDRVMPGTLMYECCLHTFRILLTRMGWTGEADRVRFEPLPGVANRLRCRGQVTESTRVVTYEVTVKEVGYGPEPYAIADALMYADGKPIVEISDMALRLAGTDREEVEGLWDRAGVDATTPAATPSLVYEKDQILAFADGAPSACFGDRYRPFDEGRFIARLPRPPYQFLDRATIVEGTPWEQREGTTAEVEYAVPPDAWYFEADRQPHMPYAVLIEAALQSCGFVSAFMGSALLSDEPLKFRNLGGKARQLRVVDRDSGLLRTTARATKINRSAGMIIQHYEMTVRDREGIVFEGETYFGFFRLQALADQVGVREASLHAPSPAELAATAPFDVPDRAPLPDRRWRMVDRVTTLAADGGPAGLGFIQGETDVDASAWFFQAHFRGDPVWPGSLGLESLLQLLKVFAEARWGVDARVVYDSPGLGAEHGWTYRGQITPDSRLVTTQAWITGVDDARRRLTADGLLAVDGKVIYQMAGYTLDARPE